LNRWWYIPNGVSERGTPEGQDVSQCEVFIKKLRRGGKKVILYAGAMGPPNNLESLVDAMAVLKSRATTDVAAVLVGRGGCRSELEQKISDLGLNDCIYLFEQVPKSAVHGLCKSAHIGFISLRNEPLFRFGVSPNKLFDYMLASLPVIFAVNAGNDIVEESQCGVSCDPSNPEEIADAIAELAVLTNEALCTLGSRGHDYVLRNHTYRELAKRYLLACNSCTMN